MTTRLDAAIDTLRDQGERVTTARRAVLAALAATSEHLSADDIAERLETEAPGVHRATVYRTLDALTRLGLVGHVHLPHGATTYHLADSGRRAHLHLACRGCDRVMDAPPDLLDEAVVRAETDIGFRIDPNHVALTGWCPECAPPASH